MDETNEMDRFYPKSPMFEPYSHIKPLLERQPKFKFPWSERAWKGEILGELEQEEHITWPNGQRKVYKHLIQLIHWEFAPDGVTDLRFCYYKADIAEKNRPTKWIFGQYSSSFLKGPMLRLMARAVAEWME
ncbi:MAG: hypothetical protein ACE5OZ_18445 [Candidatus Heimdallarchaeota archaeon]